MNNSIKQQLLWAKSVLETVPGAVPGVDSALLDAEILLAHALDKDRTYLLAWPEVILDDDKITSFHCLIEQRCEGKPIAYMLGVQEFWSLSLKVTPDTLIPRPETEQLVDAVLQEHTFTESVFVLDAGTGTGALALALAKEKPLWHVFALDYSLSALQVAVRNAQDHRLPVHFFRSDWLSSVKPNVFDIIVSNPPYIAEGDSHLPALMYEPQNALVAPDNGLADIARITIQSKQILKAGGRLYVEHGYDQGAAVKELFMKQGFADVVTRKDYAGCDRFTCGVKMSYE